MFSLKSIGACTIFIYCFIATAEGFKQLNQTIVKRETVAASEDLRSGTPEIRAVWQPIDLQRFDARYSTLPEKCGNYSDPKDCTDATACTNRSGIYMIENYNCSPYYVECDVDTYGGDWLIIQRRQDGSVDFNRDWAEYEQGFGNIDGEFFIGLKKLYALTNFNGPQELLIVMDDHNLTSKYARYDHFSIDDSNQFYKLKTLGAYSGTAGDSLSSDLGSVFTTRDRDNYYDCAETYMGGWWYGYSCGYSNLNGKYDTQYSSGLHWYHFHNSRAYSLRNVKMMIRRRKYYS